MKTFLVSLNFYINSWVSYIQILFVYCLKKIKQIKISFVEKYEGKLTKYPHQKVVLDFKRLLNLLEKESLAWKQCQNISRAYIFKFNNLLQS